MSHPIKTRPYLAVGGDSISHYEVHNQLIWYANVMVGGTGIEPVA
jgi:hypothetical protein